MKKIDKLFLLLLCICSLNVVIFIIVSLSIYNQTLCQVEMVTQAQQIECMMHYNAIIKDFLYWLMIVVFLIFGIFYQKEMIFVIKK